MSIAPLVSLACPIDRLPLMRVGLAGRPRASTMTLGDAGGSRGSFRCERGHSYDVASDGHLNLLLVQHKSSLQPGDGRDMVAARRRVHEAGLYAPVAERIVEIVERAAMPRAATPLRVLDAGCGEGYYLRRLAAARGDDSATLLQLAGVDISKWAVQAAARHAAARRDAITWVVGNNRHLPFADGSVDLILSVFGFPIWQGFRPVQAPGGALLLVDPGPDHLLELRQVIYPTVKRGEPPSIAAAMAAGWRVEDVSQVRYTMPVEGGSLLADVVAMTPHASRMPLAGREALARLDRLDVTFDVAFRLLRLPAE